MTQHTNPSYRDEDYEGCVTAGRPAGVPAPPISEEDIRGIEEAWNNPRAYELSRDEGFVSSNWIVKAVVDPNRSLFPSRNDIGRLPRWARVALAARCAHRVLPIVKWSWVNAPVPALQVLAVIVSVAEKAATAKSLDTAAYYSADISDVVRAAEADAEIRAGFGWESLTGHLDATRSVAAVDDVVTNASTTSALAAVNHALSALLKSATVRTVATLSAVAYDLDLIVRLAEREHWTDDTPVPPSVFGPMWDGPPPEWWTDEPLAETVPLINGEERPASDPVAPH